MDNFVVLLIGITLIAVISSLWIYLEERRSGSHV